MSTSSYSRGTLGLVKTALPFSHPMYGKDVLGKIDAHGDNVHGLPLSRFRMVDFDITILALRCHALSSSLPRNGKHLSLLGVMKPKTPLSPDGQKLVLEVTKQLITLSVVALGFLTSMLFTTFKGTPFVPSAMTSLFSFLFSASAGVLTQLAVVGESLSENQAIPVSYPRLLLYVTWITFVCGLVAFVVFTWANVRVAA